MTVRFSEPIAQTTSSGFTISTGGTPITVTSAGRSTANPRLFSLALSRAVGGAESISVTYTPGDLTDVAGNALAGSTMSAPAGDTTPPVLTQASVARQTLTLYFSKNVAPANGVTGFSVTVNGAPATTTSAVRDAEPSRIVLTLAAAVGSTDTVTVSYAPGNVTDQVVPAPNPLAAFTAQPVTNSSSGPSLNLAQTSGAGGTVADVVGSGYPSGATVALTWGGAARTTAPAAVTVQSNGSFSLSFTVPATPAGTYTVSAAAGGVTASGSYTVVSTLAASPAGAAAGATIAVSGTGAPASTIITVTWDGTTVVTVTGGADGSFSTTFSRPAASAGNHTISASAGAYSRSLAYTMSPALTLSPTTGPTGTLVGVTGAGFTASASVTVEWEGTTVGTATTDESGSFSVSFPSPAATSGAHAVRAATGSVIAFATFTVTP